MATKKSGHKPEAEVVETKKVNVLSEDEAERIGNVEDEAKAMLTSWTEGLTKLVKCVKAISSVRSEFVRIRSHKWVNEDGSAIKILDCKNFKQFCEDKLQRTEQTVYKMLRVAGFNAVKSNRKIDYSQKRHISAAAKSLLNAAKMIHADKGDSKLTFDAIVKMVIERARKVAGESDSFKWVLGKPMAMKAAAGAGDGTKDGKESTGTE